MLKMFRENLRSLSWVLWVVIAAFVGIVFLEVLPYVMGAGGGNVAAWGGGIEVSFADYEREYRDQETQYRQILGEGFTPEVAEGLRLRALETAFNRAIVQDEARRLGLKVTDGEVRDAILDFDAFRDEDGRFLGSDEYARMLRRFGYAGPAAFEEWMRDRLLTEKLQTSLQSTVFISEQEIEDSFRDRVERAKVRYVMLPSLQFADQANPAEDQVAAHFEANAEDYRLPEQRVASYLMVDTAQLRGSVSPSDEDVQSYYDQNPTEFTRSEEQVRARHILLRTDQRSVEDARALLEQARQRVEQGEDFAALATELSEDTGTKAQGGDLGFFGRGRMVPEFEDAAFSTEPGQLAGPIETPFGVHLLQVMEKLPPGLQALDDALRGAILSRLRIEQAEDLAEQRAGELLAKVNELPSASSDDSADGQGLSSLAEADPAVTFATTQPFDSTTPVPGFGRSGPFSQAAFELESAGDLSEPVKVPRGWVIVRLDEILPSRIPSLDEVRAQVTQEVRQQQQRQLALARLEQARTQLADGSLTLDALAGELGVEVKESDELNRNGTIVELGPAGDQVVAQAMTLDQGDIGGPFEYPLGGTLFEVAERQRGTDEQLVQERDQIRSTLETQKYQRALNAFVEHRRRQLNVQYHPQVVQDAGVLDDGSEG